ncbi:hypothetical protein ISF_00397 [Cordyceps fumosorosea ARSEF 2679]|uniref:Uncharacterized protein n=1 Tax=Cordyceps fumosorosea (strain ARSEF 2679) TaxID=1081104 RepID=A0A168E8D6_CORFA|nr:hypothetical protein ISF_00397 [Cordyceps fumosorosea ARSEF 2679]OAA73496.1 hypothetical protein ISF_00397 [Cordyceps fumosorosea ARSEF 2679]
MPVATSTATTVTPPDLSALLTPILPALAPAAASSSPAPAVLPFLAPILRQRVQILSSASSEPWLRLLCYDPAKAPRLAEIAASGALEPHPVSGEVEIDWAYDAATRFRRLDRETLQCLVALGDDHGGLTFRLVWCVDDPDGAPNGWRIGEVTVPDSPSAPFSNFGGAASIEEAERLFQEEGVKNTTTGGAVKPLLTPVPEQANGHDDDDDDDDGYWDRYDATPARTPANNRSPAPPTATNGGTGLHYDHPAKTKAADEDEDDYYAQYDDVQPAMDAHDPDEEAHAAQLDPPVAAGLSPLAEQLRRESWEAVSAQQRPESDLGRIPLQHPRPESSASSSHGSDTVAKLEAAAAAGGGMQEQSEFGVRQHVSRSIRSLFQLSRSMGIGREEFDQMVRAELDVLGMMEE